MKTFKRNGIYQDTGEQVIVAEVQDEIEIGNGDRIPGLSTLFVNGYPITAAEEKGLFKDLFTDRMIKLEN